MKYKLIIPFLVLLSVESHAFNLLNIYRHPENAQANSIFIDTGITIDFIDFDFNIMPIDVRIDYLLPLPLPFFAGVYFKTPNPNLKFFGLRTGYHLDFNIRQLDFYIFYTLEFGWIRNDLLVQYNDTKVEPKYYDFRFGVRYFFGYTARLGLCLESGFQLKSCVVLISIKLN